MLAGAELPEKKGPRQGRGALEVKRRGALEAWRAGADEHVASLIKPTSARAPDHLEEVVRRDFAFEVIVVVGAGGDEDGAKGKVDAGAQAEGGDDGAELAGLGERLDEAGALRVAEAAVVKSDAGAEKLGDEWTGELFLFGGQGKRIGERQLAGELAGQPLSVGAMRREDQNRAKILTQRTRDALRPETLDAAGEAAHKVVHFDFLEGDGTVAVLHDGDAAANSLEPSGDVRGIGDRARKEQQLQIGRGREKDALVVVAPMGIGEPVIFVDDEEAERFGVSSCPWGGRGRVSIGQRSRGDLDLNGFQGRYHHRGVWIHADIARDNADIPSAAAPLCELVVG